MTTTPQPGAREAFQFLRSVCRNFQERLMLGEAIRNGWPAPAIEAQARRGNGRGTIKYLIAIQDAAKRRYMSPEERNAIYAEFNQQQAELEARDAIKATRATRPSVPPEFKAIRAACRSMLDCDRLKAALEAGWTVEQLNHLARQFSKIAAGIPNRETPAAFRYALGFINGGEPQYFPNFLPPRLRPAASPK